MICRAVAAAIQLAPHNSLVTDFLAIVFQNYRRGEQIVGLEWDNWTGFTVVAQTSESESLVREIAAWLLLSGQTCQLPPSKTTAARRPALDRYELMRSPPNASAVQRAYVGRDRIRSVYLTC